MKKINFLSKYYTKWFKQSFCSLTNNDNFTGSWDGKFYLQCVVLM